MDLRRLRYFIGVAEQGGFHRASTLLNIAQPALTRQIRDLEEELGVSLLIRSAQGAKLSPAGEVLFSEVKRLLPQIESAGNKTKRAAMGQYGLVRIAFAERISDLRPAVAAFAETRRLLPDVDFRLTTMRSDNQIDALVAGDLDIGVLLRPPPFPQGIKYHSLSIHDCKLLVNKKHPLTKMSRVTLADLNNYDMGLVSPAVAPLTFNEVMGAFTRGGLVPRIAFEVNTDATLLNLVEEGIAIGFADSSLGERLPIVDSMFLTVKDFNYPVHLGVAWQIDRETPAILQFVDQISKRMGMPDTKHKSKRARHR